MRRTLRLLAWAMGASNALIGFAHVVGGIDSVPGERDAGATVDSRERFYGAIFAGYGGAWLWVASRSPVPAWAVRWLAGIFWFGAAGRLLSWRVAGRPHVFQEVLTVIEVAVPAALFVLADADERAVDAEQAA